MEDRPQALCIGQLLRSLPQRRRNAAMAPNDLHRRSRRRRGWRSPSAGSARRGGSAGHPVQQKRPAGDRLAVMVGVGETDEQRPPVVDQRDQPGHVLAAVRSRVVNPAQPHWFFSSSNRFSHPPIAVQLCERPHLVVQRGHQHGELVARVSHIRFDQREPALRLILALSSSCSRTRRVSTITRRGRLQPESCKVAPPPPSPGPHRSSAPRQTICRWSA